MNDSAPITPLLPNHVKAFCEAERLLFHFDFCQYLELKKLFRDASDEGRRRFKALFRRYYTMNTGGVTDEFCNRYFSIMFGNGVIIDGRPAYESILNELSLIKRRKGDYAMPFSFVSKLVGMHDERHPIYDRHVCNLFQVQAPSASIEKVERIKWFVSLIDNIRASYQAWAVDPRMVEILQRLRIRDPQLASCDVVRQMDFLVWKVGNEKLLKT